MNRIRSGVDFCKTRNLALHPRLNHVHSHHITRHVVESRSRLLSRLIDFYLNLPSRKIVAATASPYFMLRRDNNPIGFLLLAWPALWSLNLATPPHEYPSIYLVSLLGVGSWIMRGAGCTMNDIIDRKLDALVERTKMRPLARGDITVQQAILFLFLQLLGALGVLSRLNEHAQVVSALSLAPVCMYPLAKRYMSVPQLYLGMTFNWGAFVGWSSMHGNCDMGVCIPLYISCVIWTLFYDTIYAHQDIQFDRSIGINSSAIYLGRYNKVFLHCLAYAFGGSMLIAGFNGVQEFPYFVSILLACLHLNHQARTLNVLNPHDCARAFKSNNEIGIIIFMGTLINNL